MSLVTWNSSFNLKVKVIDEHHRHLVKLLNQSYNAIRLNDSPKIRIILKELHEYTKYHFSTEEDMMMLYDFPSHSSHKKEHARFAHQVGELQSKLASGEALYNIKIVVFLKDWLMNHILISDRELAIYLAGKGVV